MMKASSNETPTLERDIQSSVGREENSKLGYLEFVSIMGTKMYFNINLLPLFLRQTSFFTVFAASILLLSLIDPTNISPRGGYGATFLVWACIATLYVGLTILVMTVLYFTLRFKMFDCILLPISSLAVIYALILSGQLIEKYILNDPNMLVNTVSFTDFLYFFVLEQVFLTLYVSLGFPLTVRNLELENSYPGSVFDLKTNPRKDTPTKEIAISEQGVIPPLKKSSNLIQIGSQVFDVRDVRYILAEEHYVRVRALNKETLIREKFSQVISRFPNGFGYQVHRSYWLAFSCVKDVIRHEKKHKVLLDGNELIPVSETRRKKFLENLYLYRDVLNE